MNIAILSVTNQGKEISDKIYSLLVDDPTVLSVTQYHKNVFKTIDTIFSQVDCIIAIMASGIIIRAISPHVKSKLSDPSVLLIDDHANFVISLLSGHIGGANELTSKIAKLIGSTPVITTSTDVNNKLGIDSIAKHFYCNLENPKNIKHINKSLVNHNKVDLYLPHKFDYILCDKINDSYNIYFDDSIDYIKATVDGNDVILRPKQLVMGIGARRDISRQKVHDAILKACEILKIPPSRIDFFATADVKANEDGIIYNVNQLNKKISIIDMSDIKKYQNDECSKSDFVMKQFGVKGVCEPTALMANGENAHLIFKKTAYDGVTIAVSIKD